MSILKRFTDIMSSNINALLDKAEDPVKMIDQLMRNLNDDLNKVKAETASVMAEETRTKREVNECQSDVNKMLDYAKRAVEAGNDEAAYMLADNANMIVSGEFTDDGNVIESTVRGIKLGDSIDKVIELYGDTKQRSADIKDVFSHDGLKDSGAYNYFLKIDSTKDYFYAFRFRVDQNNNIIAVVIEPISMKYWSED